MAYWISFSTAYRLASRTAVSWIGGRSKSYSTRFLSRNGHQRIQAELDQRHLPGQVLGLVAHGTADDGALAGRSPRRTHRTPVVTTSRSLSSRDSHRRWGCPSAPRTLRPRAPLRHRRARGGPRRSYPQPPGGRAARSARLAAGDDGVEEQRAERLVDRRCLPAGRPAPDGGSTRGHQPRARTRDPQALSPERWSAWPSGSTCAAAALAIRN